MVTIRLLLFLFLVYSANLISQDKYPDPSICELINEDYDSLLVDDKTIDYELNKILDIIGFYNQDFFIQACTNLENAITFKHDGNNYILYGERFLKSITNNSNLWAKTFYLIY